MDSLDTFGSFFIKDFRDKSLDNLPGLLNADWKAPELQSLPVQSGEMVRTVYCWTRRRFERHSPPRPCCTDWPWPTERSLFRSSRVKSGV